MVIFIAGLAATIYNIVLLMEEFFRFPVITSSDLTNEPSVFFPAVTVCNLNRYCTDRKKNFNLVSFPYKRPRL